MKVKTKVKAGDAAKEPGKLEFPSAVATPRLKVKSGLKAGLTEIGFAAVDPGGK